MRDLYYTILVMFDIQRLQQYDILFIKDIDESFSIMNSLILRDILYFRMIFRFIIYNTDIDDVILQPFLRSFYRTIYGGKDDS